MLMNQFKRHSRAVAVFVVMTLLLTGSVACANTAIEPTPRDDAGWMKRHEKMNARVAEGNVDLLYIGDSITHGWEGGGKNVWAEYYGDRNAVNLGIGGDRTQHVLWRLENGNVDGISPKAAVLMIGTNNHKDNSPEEIGAGIIAVVDSLRAKLPDMKILILAIFPRGEGPSKLRENMAEASAIAATKADGDMVHYLDIGNEFLAEDSTLSKEVMPDLLHLNESSYRTWAEAVEEKVAELMGELVPTE